MLKTKCFNTPHLNILNIPFTSMKGNEITNKLLHICEPTIVVTPNIDHIVRSYFDRSTEQLYASSDLCLNDSRVFSFLLSAFFKIKLAAIPGSDVTQSILNSEHINDKTVAIVGGEHQQIRQLQNEVIHNKHVELKHFNPPMKFYNNEQYINESLQFIQKSHADIIFLAVGSPQQEMLAHRVKPLLKKGVIICVGASIDYLTGKEKRAPLWIQKISMEWFFRFLQSPINRFKRYFISCPKIFYILWKERQKLRQIN